MKLFLCRIVVGGGMLALGCGAAQAAVTNIVNVGSAGLTFTPSRVTNHVGDVIHFVPFGATHTVSSNGVGTEPFCGNSTITTPCDVVFNTAGVFPFKCIPHAAFGMTGVVTVLSSGNAAPTIAISSPSDGTLFLRPTNFVIQASAGDSDGVVTQVQFFADSVRLGVKSSVPFTFTTANLAPGSHILTAIATDDAGAETTSSAVHVTINDPPVVNLLNLTNGAVVVAAQPLTLQANAVDHDGTVASVEFLAGTTSLGISANRTPPYQLLVPGLPAGTPVITARAVDDRGAATTSNPVQISVVTPQPLRFETPRLAGPGQLALKLSVTPGLRYVIEESADFTTWNPTVTFTAVSNSFTLPDAISASATQRVFRGHLLPNP